MTANPPRWRKPALLALLLLALAALFFTPHLTLMRMRDAAQARDAQALSAHVDFKRLREQLKTGVQRRLAERELGEDGKPTPASAFGAALAGALLSPMVDALLTPDSLARLLQGLPPARAAAGATLGGEAPARADVETRMGYESPNRFVFAIARRGEAPVELVLYRERLLFWKLAELRLPQ